MFNNSLKTYEASLYSVGGNLQGINKILKGDIKNGFTAVKPPRHHSNSYKCDGFCIFNNVAIDAEYLCREKDIKKIAIIDWDCYHGNCNPCSQYCNLDNFSHSNVYH